MVKILLVEDDTELADLYKLQFEKSGYQLEYVTNGLEAVAKVATIAPDLVLLDIMLPGLNGLEVLKQFKDNETVKNIPVVILSNLPEEAAREKGLNLGAVSYLVKSNTTPLGVISIVDSILKGQK